MTFLQLSTRVGGDGPLDAKIVLVGEAPSTEEIKQGKPFVGVAGSILNNALMIAGIPRSSLYITNIFKEKVSKQGDHIYTAVDKEKLFDGRALYQKGIEYQEELIDELHSIDTARVIVPLGLPAMYALLGMPGILKFRGYPFRTGCESHRANKHWLKNCKPYEGDAVILPTIHPAATVRGVYLWRYFIIKDLQRAKELSHRPTFHFDRHEYQTINNADSCIDALKNFYIHDEDVAVDIEVLGKEISCLAISSKSDTVVIPFVDGGGAVWTEDEEVEVWSAIAVVLRNKRVRKIFHNAAFDCYFLWHRNKIYTAPPVGDTMVRFSVQYPEFKKDLGLLGSLFCFRPYWKDLVKLKQTKGEA